MYSIPGNNLMLALKIRDTFSFIIMIAFDFQRRNGKVVLGLRPAQHKCLSGTRKPPIPMATTTTSPSIIYLKKRLTVEKNLAFIRVALNSATMTRFPILQSAFVSIARIFAIAEVLFLSTLIHCQLLMFGYL